MAKPTKAQVKELFDVHFSPTVVSERLQRSYGFDDTRRWIDENGHRLSDRVWQQRLLVRDQIDQVLRLAIASGEDALLTAKKLEQFFDPAFAPIRTERGRLVRNQRRAIVTEAPGRGGSGSFAARRLARTEITRAHGAATIWAAQRTPFAVGVKWSLSGRHPKSDECDINASRDNGLGRGVYLPKEAPRYPAHPMCLCTLSIETVKDDKAIIEELRRKYTL